MTASLDNTSYRTDNPLANKVRSMVQRLSLHRVASWLRPPSTPLLAPTDATSLRAHQPRADIHPGACLAADRDWRTRRIPDYDHEQPVSVPLIVPKNKRRQATMEPVHDDGRTIVPFYDDTEWAYVY